MVTFDITKLYSNIPYELGKQAISFLIEKYLGSLHPRFNKKWITDGIALILNNNSFQFNDMNYIHTLETAMRTKMSPTYATLTLAYLEENLYEIIVKKIQQQYKNRIYCIKWFQGTMTENHFYTSYDGIDRVFHADAETNVHPLPVSGYFISCICVLVCILCLYYAESNILQNSSCMAIYLPSQKPST